MRIASRARTGRAETAALGREGRPGASQAGHLEERPGRRGVGSRDDLKRVQLVQLIGPHGALWQVTEPRP